MGGNDEAVQLIRVTEDWGDAYAEISAYRVPVPD